jgi:hypothetical protein
MFYVKNFLTCLIEAVWSSVTQNVTSILRISKQTKEWRHVSVEMSQLVELCLAVILPTCSGHGS